MTDITDQDRRAAREWAEKIDPTYRGNSQPLINAARVILATVDAPAPTLAEAMRTWAAATALNFGEEASFDPLIARVEQIEEERDEARKRATANLRAVDAVRAQRDEARAEVAYWKEYALERQRVVERLTAQNAWPKTTPSGHTYDAPTTYKELRHQCANAAQAASEGWDDAECPPEPTWEMVGLATAERVTDPSLTLNDGSMMRPATVAREENVAPDQQANTQETLSGSLPNPADVPYGQTWIVEYHGDHVPALRRLDHPGDWYLVRKNGTGGHVRIQDITLVSRLVPAPRQVTTREELNALPEGTVIRARGELVCERYRHRSKGLVWISTGVDDDFPVDRPVLPATVLWTPEETK